MVKIKKLKTRGGTGAPNPQSMQRTLTWTNPLKFLQNTRYGNFLNKDGHLLRHKVSKHLDVIEKRTGKRSIKHILTD